AMDRCNNFWKPEYVEQTIYRIRALLAEASLEDRDRSMFMYGLAYLQDTRLGGPDLTSDPTELLLSYLGLSEPPSFQALMASLRYPTELNTDNIRIHYYT